jgi:citrate synthase
MLYKGTNIDGLTAAVDGLEIRGQDLCRLIGELSFTESIVRLINGGESSAAHCREADSFLVDCLRRLETAPAMPGTTGTAGLAARLLALPPDFAGDVGIRAFELGGDLRLALAGAAILPAMAAQMLRTACASDAKAQAIPDGAGYVSALFQFITGRPTHSPAELAMLDALLVAWHGGFGIVTPTVLVPRVVAGTGAPALHALAAGVLAGGPRHIGASAEAFRFIAAIVDAVEAGVALEVAVADGITASVAATGLVYGMGHPLLEQDPRPHRLREVASILGDTLPLQVYDAAVANLRATRQLSPNVDMSTAAILLSLGVTDPEMATAVALGARAFCMVAHIAERRAKPAFGVDRATARFGFQQLDVNWL